MQGFVINLAERPERAQAFFDDWPHEHTSGVVDEPSLWIGVDANLCPKPDWWRGPLGAWGCYRSHLAILEKCLNEGPGCVAIFEDDAVPTEHVSSLREAVRSLPDDWEVAYLGGQLLKAQHSPPTRVNAHWLVGHNVNRTHAYMVRGEGLKKLYRHICSVSWSGKHHVDHWYGKLHEQGVVRAYVPNGWFFTQRPDQKSDVDGKVKDVRHLLKDPDKYERPVAVQPRRASPLVVIVGLHSSGSSALAGALHAMGVYMGRNFRGHWDGGHEDGAFARIMENWMPFPNMKPRTPFFTVAARVHAWLRQHRRAAEKAGFARVGVKYPHICAFGRDVDSLFGERVLVVSIDRPLGESTESLIRRCQGKRWSDEQLVSVQDFLWRAKTEMLRDRDDVIHVDWSELKADPVTVTQSLAGRLELPWNPAGAVYVHPTAAK